MQVMEENKPWGAFAFPSLRQKLEGMSPVRGHKALYLNAALAMFVMATPEEQDEWVQKIESARRLGDKDELSMLDRVAATVSPDVSPTPSSVPPSSLKGLHAIARKAAGLQGTAKPELPRSGPRIRGVK